MQIDFDSERKRIYSRLIFPWPFYLICYSRKLFVFRCPSTMYPSQYRFRFFFNVWYIALLFASEITAKNEKSNNLVADVQQTRWISTLMSEAENAFTIDESANAKCKRDYELYELHRQNQSIWALRMMESSEWPRDNLFFGTTYHLGSWSECMMVNKYDVQGQYCLVGVTYNTSGHRFANNSLKYPDEGASVWDALEEYKHEPWRLNRQHLKWALCVPASCRTNELQISLNKTLYPLFQAENLNIDVTVDPRFCSTNTKPNYPPGFYWMWAFIAAIIAITTFCGIIDHLNTKKENAKSAGGKKSLQTYVVKSFSIVHNMKSLLHVSPTHSPTTDFVKLVYMICILRGHRYLFAGGYPRIATEYIEQGWFGHKHASYSSRAMMIVDIFFMVSGFLTFHFGYPAMRKSGVVYIIQSIIVRWSKMVPLFVVIMLFMINVFPYLNEGPWWNYRTGIEMENCQQTFWNHVFAFGNVVNPEKMCLVTSWYISVDIQLTIIGTILVYIVTKNRLFGIFCSLMVFAIGAAVTIVVTYVYKYHAVLHAYMSFLSEPRDTIEYTRYYVKTYTRIAPYMIGFLAAYITKRKMELNIVRLEKELILAGLGGIVLKFVTFEYTERLFDFVKDYDRLEQSIAAVLVRTLFVIPEAGIQIACFSSNLVGVTRICEQKIWVPLGRLLFCVFCVHIPIQLYSAAGSQALITTVGYYNQTLVLISDVCASFMAALILHLLVEAPAVNIMKIILMVIFRKKPPVKNETEKQAHNNKSFELNEAATNPAADTKM